MSHLGSSLDILFVEYSLPHMYPLIIKISFPEAIICNMRLLNKFHFILASSLCREGRSQSSKEDVKS